MAATSNATLLADLLDPQVVADYIDKKLVDAIRLSPLARIDNTLVGRPGDEVTLPQYSYIGDSNDVLEGHDIPIAKLSSTVDKVKIMKIGKAVEFSDEAVLSSFNGIGGGDGVAEEAAKQILVSVNAGVENTLLNKMNTSANLTGIIPSTGDPADAISDALVKFGEDIDGDKVLVIPPEFQARLRNSKGWIPNTEIGAEIIVRGVVGMVHGCQIITSNRVRAHDEYVRTADTTVDVSKTYYQYINNQYVAAVNPADDDLPDLYEKTAVPATSFIVKPGALAIYMKRNTLVEFDRDIISEMNYIKGSKMFAPYVYDKSKLIKLTLQ